MQELKNKSRLEGLDLCAVPNNNIRIDCYLAILDRTRKLYPNARFEIITRRANHPLSPSWKLLNYAKDTKMPYDDYCLKLAFELIDNPVAIQLLEELAIYSLDNLLFLVCYEKDASKCHRSYIKSVLEHYQKILERNKKIKELEGKTNGNAQN